VAEADAFATETGGYLLAIPGVADDLQLFADGQFEQRANGTARLTAFVRRQSAIDREFFLELEFAGRLDPQSPGHPPAGSPVTTLLPAAYAPLGPADPTQYVYFTQVTGSLVGLRTYGGARILATAAAPVQMGVGANNKNVAMGLAANLALQIVQQPVLAPLAPTGPAQLRATLRQALGHCASHVDADPAYAPNPGRACANMPGLAADYLFLPAGEWTENPDGTARLQGLLRRQNDYADRWLCDLQCAGRVDPGHPAHPPSGSPVLQLLQGAYAPQGGPIDPAAWRYYTFATGTLVGDGGNAGGRIALANSGAVQVGLGAAQGNLFFGAMGSFTPTVVSQPTGRTIAPTGDVALQWNLGTACILPPAQVLTGQNQTLPTVTELPAVYTGTDLGFCEQVAVGTWIIASQDPRRWFDGWLHVVDHQTVRVHLPQTFPAGTHPVMLLTRSGGTAQMTLQTQPPAVPTLRTEDSILPGQTQHWVVHQGHLQGPVLTYLLLSGSDLPSLLPGLISLGIGNQFQELLVVPGLLHDPVTGLLVVPVNGMSPVFLGTRLFSQAAMIELLSQNPLPLPTSGVWSTQY